MHTPKLRPSLVGCEITKQGGSHNKVASCCSSLRCWLIVWACMRVVVSVIWTIVLLVLTSKEYMNPNGRNSQHYSVLARRYIFFTFGVIATIAQLVEIGMLITFIIAGIKRKAFYYRVYYHYCIVTLITYIIGVILCFSLDYQHAHFFGDFYLTFQLVYIFEEGAIMFGVAAGLSICLEVLLIYLIKRLIKKYEQNEDYSAGQIL